MMIRRTTTTPDYFRVFEIPLLQGRCFTERETAASAPLAIINEAMAQRFWPNQNPLGKYIVQGESEPVVRQIVGVVGNVRHYLRYFASDDFVKSFTSFPDDVVYIPGYENALIIRTEGDPVYLLATMQKEVRAMDKNVVLSDVGTVEGEIATLFSPQRFNTLFLGAFAAIALTLTSIGIYGTVAYAVSRRTHEIGIRMALGAERADVLSAVLKQGIKLVLAGIAIGIAGALALTRMMTSLLHDVSPTDPLTFACISGLLVSVALLASYIPARRAAKVDPMVALRYE
jgi:putative ABC transport system permease protein